MCLALVGGLVSAVGVAAKAAADSAGYEAQAKFANRQSVLEQQKGAYEAKRLERSNDRKLSAMRGQFLSSGIALEGSPVDVISDSATEASLDEQAIKFGAQIRSDNMAFESRLARQNASSARIGGALGMFGSVLQGAAEQRNHNARLAETRNPYSRTVIANPYVF